MLHFLRAYPRHTIIMLLAQLLAGLMEGISLTALLPMLNIAVGGTKTSGIGKTVTSALHAMGIAPTASSLLMVVVAGVLLKSALVLLADRKVGYTVALVATDLRLTLLRAILGTRWEYYISHPIGSLANSAASEVIRASTAYVHGTLAVTYMVTCFVYAVVALMISWKASVVAFAAGCLLMVLLNRLIRKAKKAGRQETSLMQSLLSRLTDCLQSVKPLKAMGREQLAEKMLEKDTLKLNKALRKQVYSKAILKSLQEPFLILIIVAGLYATLVLWNYELPSVMVMVFLLARLLGEFGKMQRKLQEMSTCESAFWSLQQKIDDANLQQEPNLGQKKVELEKNLRFDGVSFSYGKVQILKSVSLEIPAGASIAVIGPSGAGKTTLVDLVTGLLRPQQGEVLVDGVPMSDMDVKYWRSKIGYVPQDTVLLHDSILANITLGDSGLDATDAEAALRAAGAWDFVSAMPEGLETIVGERGSQLSGGQRQRIAIARALAHRPALLILDEATSALDPESEKAICETLASLRGKVTMLAISHQPALVKVADRVYGLRDKTVVLDRSEPTRVSTGTVAPVKPFHMLLLSAVLSIPLSFLSGTPSVGGVIQPPSSTVTAVKTQAIPLWRQAYDQYELGRTSNDPRKKSAHFRRVEALAQQAIKADLRNDEGYKWLAVALGARAEDVNVRERIRLSRKVKENIEKALSLDPDDDISLLVLSRWHYKIASLPPWTGAFVGFVYGGLPPASLEKAESLLLRAIATKDRISHRYSLAKVYHAMGRREAALAQLRQALKQPVTFPEEAEDLAKARKKLINWDP